jgi:hypothetical protein
MQAEQDQACMAASPVFMVIAEDQLRDQSDAVLFV